ncbi:tripartite tricarboxylate transporter TctB family protein [Halobacterium sp. R2-5]|uniref:tripartite tricarboxylate transporter TctB family protein n=1 Tax=Halobacterium sp. R2-5 TaxID=2715751 RepID=UPI00141F2D2D|nr:tripartite tricarboxylate transporter TctB family protein [Halobacterium sp. R2-5]NIC01024.1 tripartite tricarboxylate transporter TctB family protein [Halobacterium sp. R2-5]
MEFKANTVRERLDETIHLRKSTGEIAILVLLGVLGAFAAIYSQLNLPLENPFGAGVGPRLFPQLAGVTMVLMSVYLLSIRLWRRRRKELDDKIVEMQVRDGLRVLTFILLCAGYMLVFENIGFGVSTTALLFLLFMTNGFRRYLLAAVLAIGFTVAIYLVFTTGLGLPLPSPLLRDLITGVL